MLSNKQTITSIIMCLLVVICGTAGYVLIEGFSILDGFYMTIITITTVGFSQG